MNFLSRAKLSLFSLISVLFFLSSCSSYYWADIDSVGIETGDKVYKLRTVSGDLLNFRTHPGSSAIYNGEEILGTDESGNELSIGLDEVEEIELAAWGSDWPYFVGGCCAAGITYVLFIMHTRLVAP